MERQRQQLQQYILYLLSFMNNGWNGLFIMDFFIVRKLEMLNNVVMNCNDDFFPTLIRNTEDIAQEMDMKFQNEQNEQQIENF